MKNFPVGKAIGIALMLGLALLLIFWLWKNKSREEILEVMEQTDKFFGKLLSFHEVRKDNAGDGSFNSKRTHGKHQGIDLVAHGGAVVFSPINGKITRKAFPYKGDEKYQGVLIEGRGEHKGIQFKIFYITPDADLIGTEVKKGQRIGIAQRVSEKYPGQGMKDHIHVELLVENEHQDPTKALFA